MKRITALLGGAAIVVTAGLSAAAPAMAATAVGAAASASNWGVQQVNPTTYISPLAKTLNKEPLTGAWIIRTRSCLSVCYELTSQGLGLAFQTEGTGFSTFNRSEPSGADGWIYTTAGGGYCVHGTSSGPVIASNSACGASNTASQWITNAGGEMVNVAYGGFMGQDGLGNNWEVQIEPTSGAYYDEPNND